MGYVAKVMGTCSDHVVVLLAGASALQASPVNLSFYPTFRLHVNSSGNHEVILMH